MQDDIPVCSTKSIFFRKSQKNKNKFIFLGSSSMSSFYLKNQADENKIIFSSSRLFIYFY